jgi:hypothetical protein
MSERAACPRLFASDIVLWLIVCCLAVDLLVFSLVVAVSTFEQRIVRRYNNTHCTYCVNLQHEGSISELHCAKSFFLARARTVQFVLQTIITRRRTPTLTVKHSQITRRVRLVPELHQNISATVPLFVLSCFPHPARMRTSDK